MTDTAEIRSDRPLTFTIPSRDVRGRAVRLDRVLDEILAAHAYPPAITHLLAEALVVTALIGSLIKQDGGQMTMQAQTDGGTVRLLVCDWREGELRGYVDFDGERLAALGANPSLYALFGQGYLAITFDRSGEDGRWQGIVPLEGASLAEACESYFAQSEQVPTLIRVATRLDGDRCRAGGMLVQHMPDGEEGRERLAARVEDPSWDHVAVLAGSVRHEELLDTDLPLEALVWRLFHEEDAVRVAAGPVIVRGCRCTAAHYEQIIRRFPASEQAEMRDANGQIVVDCAFCSRQFCLAL